MHKYTHFYEINDSCLSNSTQRQNCHVKNNDVSHFLRIFLSADFLKYIHGTIIFSSEDKEFVHMCQLLAVPEFHPSLTILTKGEFFL